MNIQLAITDALCSCNPLVATYYNLYGYSMPANGNVSCSSGRSGVGYEGDTCI